MACKSGKIINYLFGLINVTLFLPLSFSKFSLYASLLLQIFFFAANIYGWYAWSRVNDFEQAELRIRWLKPSHRLFLIIVSIAAIVALTFNIDTVFGYLAVVAVDILNVFGANFSYTSD